MKAKLRTHLSNFTARAPKTRATFTPDFELSGTDEDIWILNSLLTQRDRQASSWANRR